MEKPPLPAATAPPQTGLHRLILAASAAGALATLCWAALQVRTARAEIRQLQQQLAAQSSPGMPPSPAPAPPHSAATPDSDRRLAAAETERKQAADTFTSRITELENVIVFLRQENSAAQQTIERLSRAQPEPAPLEAAEPVKTKSGRSPARNEQP